MVTKIIREADLNLLPIKVGELVVTTDLNLYVNNGVGLKPIIKTGKIGGSTYTIVGNVLEQFAHILVPSASSFVDVVFSTPFKAGTQPTITFALFEESPMAVTLDLITNIGFRILVHQHSSNAYLMFSAKGDAP